jgi:UDP-N-acetylmuramyl pentapeptide phosphotransferase/UDP-N-acetylglucosamine-1-phosphate transferase
VGLAVGTAYFATVENLLPFEVALPSPALWLGALLMVLTGLYDDVHAASFKKKFVIQALVAYLMLHAGYRIEVAQLPFVEGDVYRQALYNIPLTMLWIVGVINAVNLLDGLDGLAAGVALIGFASLGLVFGLRGELGAAVSALVLAGALLGFLAHNRPPATIFMGDSGSLLVGLLLATYALQARAHADPTLALAIPVVALGLPVLETTVSIARRLINRASPFAPDRDHIHHRLSRATTSRWAVLVLYGVSLLFGLVAALLVEASFYPGLSLIAVTAGGVYLWLRKLGYLRVRRSLRTATQHYDLPLKQRPKQELPDTGRRGPREAASGAGNEPLQAGSTSQSELALQSGSAEQLLAHFDGELAGKTVALWAPAQKGGQPDGWREISGRLARGLREKGAAVSRAPSGAAEDTGGPSAALEEVDVLLICTGEPALCAGEAHSLK